MYKNEKISVIIPCYNEEKNIGRVIWSIPNFVDEIIIVDNNSTDATKEVAVKNKATVLLEKKQGVGNATRRGLKTAKGDILIVMDGDGQHNGKDIIDFVELVLDSGIHVVTGSRFLKNKIRSVNGGIVRDLGNFIQTFIFNLLFKARITDSQCGMWAFRKEVLDILKLKSEEFSIVEEFKIRALKNNLKLQELPINCKARLDNSKLSPLKDGLKNIAFLFNIFYEFKAKKDK
jgi:glycosyltransferase involved in cell wall biosynthesis